jgi:hypothetical protein
MRVHTAAHQKISAYFTGGGVAHRLINAELVESRAAFEMEIVQEIEDHITRRRHEVHVPGRTVAVHRHRAAAVGKKGSRKPNVGHVAKGRIGDVRFGLRIAWSVIQQTDAGAYELDVSKFLRRNACYQTVEGTKFRFAAKIEALEHVISKGRHFSILSAEELLQRGRLVRVGRLRERKFSLQPVDT